MITRRLRYRAKKGLICRSVVDSLFSIWNTSQIFQCLKNSNKNSQYISTSLSIWLSLCINSLVGSNNHWERVCLFHFFMLKKTEFHVTTMNNSNSASFHANRIIFILFIFDATKSWFYSDFTSIFFLILDVIFLLLLFYTSILKI